MDKRSGQNVRRRAMNAGTLIAGVLNRHAAKQIEAGLGCSPRQARRIAATGKVPSAFRTAFVRLIDRALADNKREIARLEDELRGLAYEEMVARAEARRAAAMGPDAPSLPGLADGTAQPDAVAAPAARRAQS